VVTSPLVVLPIRVFGSDFFDTLMLPISFQENEWFVFTVPDLSCPKKFCATVCKAPTAAGASTQQRHRQHARGDKVKVRGDNAGRDN